MRSSYIQNNYGEILRGIVIGYCPIRIVELGVLDGYSTLHMALGLRWNEINRGVIGRIFSFDLWDEYPYKHGDMEDVLNRLQVANVDNYVSLKRGDAFEAWQDFEDRSINLLHVDISNTGSVVQRIMKHWDRKVCHGGVVLLEGGSVERDNTDWMYLYQKPSIKLEIETNPIINGNYVYGTYLPFPSLTYMLKKWENVYD